MKKVVKETSVRFLSALLCVMAIGASEAKSQSKVKAPANVILILADDLGYGDLGYTGSKDIKTPHIDRLASTGIVCTNGYASHSFCAPTRAGIMTGRYQHRFGFQNNPSKQLPNHGLPTDEVILPKVLKQAAYTSALVGKWHLGVHQHQHPLTKGFDEFYGFTAGGHDFFSCDPKQKNDHAYDALIEHNGERKDFEGYLTEDLTRFGMDFMERNQDHPFFLFMSYNAPHTPLQAPEKYLNRMSHIKDKKRRTYAAMISALDDGVGQLMSKLKELNLDENTLVLFMSDNGGAPFSWPDNKPFNGCKGTVLEGGVHVPYIVNWKGQLKPGTYTNLVMSFDIFATATALAGLDNPADRKIDSKNLIPYLKGENKAEPHKVLYWTQGDYQEAARAGDYKLVKIGGKENYLFDLKEDVGETSDVSQQNKKALKKLDKRFKKWKSELPKPELKDSGLANDMQRNYVEDIKKTKK